MDEIDVVDESDAPIGRSSREIAHRRSLLHRSVHVFVFNRGGDLYLQRRALAKLSYPGMWTSSASGHVDAGESYEKAALREMNEELGVCADLFPLGKFRYQDALENEWSMLYEAHYDGPITPDPTEVAQGKFAARSEVAAWLSLRPADFAPSFPLAWRQFQEARPARRV